MLPIVIDTFNESTINRIKIIFYPNVSDRLFNGFPAVVCQVNILYLYLEIISNTCIWHYAISLHSRFSVHQVDIIKLYLDMFIASRLTTIKRNCFIFLFLHLKPHYLHDDDLLQYTFCHGSCNAQFKVACHQRVII